MTTFDRECPSCRAAGKRPIPPILPDVRIFPKETRFRSCAFRCEACGNYWVAEDPSNLDAVCPRCCGRRKSTSTKSGRRGGPLTETLWTTWTKTVRNPKMTSSTLQYTEELLHALRDLRVTHGPLRIPRTGRRLLDGDHAAGPGSTGAPGHPVFGTPPADSRPRSCLGTGARSRSRASSGGSAAPITAGSSAWPICRPASTG